LLTDWKSAGRDFLRATTDEIRLNVRLYRMTWIVGYLFCGYLFFALYDASMHQKEKLALLYNQSERVSRVGNIELWQSREEQQRTLQDDLRQYCWIAANPQLASADVQTTLQRIIGRYQILNSRLTVATPEVSDGSIWRIRAQLTGKLDSASHYLALLKDLEDLKRFIAVERVSLTSSGRGETMDMLVSVCFVGDEVG